MAELLDIGAAKFKLVHERPYLAVAIYSLREVPTKGLGTMATDKRWRLYFDPDLEWDVPTAASVLYHEIQHLLRDHMSRGEGLHPFKWNLAADCEINDDIDEEKQWNLPEGVVYPEHFGMKRNDFAEMYYEGIKVEEVHVCGTCGSEMKDKNDSGNGQDSGNEQGSGQDSGQDSGEGDGGDSGGDSAGDSKGAGKCPQCGQNAKSGAGRCGSGASGSWRPWEQADSGDVSSGKSAGVSEVEGDLIRKKVAQDINEQSKKGRGTVPGHLERWAEEFLNPKVNWREQLRVAINNALFDVAGQADYTYKRPSRRGSAWSRDIVFPSMVAPTVQVAVVVDTSGSMQQSDLESCLAEIKGIITAIGMKNGITVLAVDAEVHTVGKVFNPRQVQLQGGGGTDMRIGIDAAMEVRPKPDVIIVLTDGYTPWPDREIGSKLIIGIVGEEGAFGDSYNTPAWAKTIYIDKV